MAAHSSLFPNDLPHLTHTEMAAEILDWLKRHPVSKIHHSSRIPSLCRIVAKAAGHESQPGDDKYVELVQSFKDIQEVWLVVRVLGDRLLSAPFAEPFQRAAANDPQLPEASGEQTKGRDAQFELFVGAIGDRVGFNVSHLGQGQPDWQMAAAIRTWTVEAKRAKSQEAVNKNTNKAAAQIRESQIGGIIAIDVSAIGGVEKRRLRTCVPDEELESARQRMGDAILKDGLPQLKAEIGDAPVGLVVIHDYLIRPAGKKPNGDAVAWGLHGMWWSYFLVRNQSQQHERYGEFLDLWQSGLPNL